MSYCPFGTQAQKWYLQVMDKLGKVADVKVRFVNYLMHWEKEWEQNLREYCIQKEQNDKFVDYLKCFLKEWDNDWCIKSTKINENKLKTCVNSTKKDINYEENIANKTTRFPLFDLETAKNNQYGVQWSPTFVLNWIKVDKVWRDAKSYADLICNSFKEKPKECDFEFDSTTYDPNFWFTSNWQAVSGWCGG
jgi:outer membrane cobalamin receptor